MNYALKLCLLGVFVSRLPWDLWLSPAKVHLPPFYNNDSESYWHVWRFYCFPGKKRTLLPCNTCKAHLNVWSFDYPILTDVLDWNTEFFLKTMYYFGNHRENIFFLNQLSYLFARYHLTYKRQCGVQNWITTDAQREVNKGAIDTSISFAKTEGETSPFWVM